MTSWLRDQERLEALQDRAAEAEEKLITALSALQLIAMPKRPDGTYNRSRRACEELARKTLEEMNQ